MTDTTIEVEFVPAREPWFNLSARKVGGIWFFKVGRLRFSFCVARSR